MYLCFQMNAEPQYLGFFRSCVTKSLDSSRDQRASHIVASELRQSDWGRQSPGNGSKRTSRNCRLISKRPKTILKEVLAKMEISYSDALHKELNLLSYKETDLKRDIKNFTANFEYLEKQV